MLKNKTKMFLLFSLVLITMIGMTAISAADANDTVSDTQISDASNQVVDTVKAVDTSDNNKVLSEKTDNIKSVSNKVVKSDGEAGTLTDLATDINNAEDTITLDKDYTSTSTENPITISKDITIDGNGKTITAVNGALVISSSNTVTIKDLTFQGKNGEYAVIANNGKLNLLNVTFNDCFSTTYSNPAVLDNLANSEALLDGCSINNTCSTTAPIRINGANSKLTINNTNITNVISKNSIVYAAANDHVIIIDNSILANGKDTNYGGAIYDNYRGTLIVNNTIIENNTAAYRGGGIYTKANTTVTNTIFRNNTLTAATYNRPEGIWVDNVGAYLYVENNVFENNHAGYNEAYYFNNGKYNSTVKITVASYDFDEEDTVVFIALVTDDNGNPIGDRLGTITFETDGKTFTSGAIENGTAYVIPTGLDVDQTYIVTATYSNAPEEKQEVTLGKVNYGNVLDAMTDYTSLQQVIDAQETDATISLNNVITRAEGETKVVIRDDITINGKGLTVDANEGTFIEIANGATVTLKNVVITNGNAENLIDITNGNLVLDNVIIDNSTTITTYLKEGLISVKKGSTLVLNNSIIKDTTGIAIDALGTSTIIDNTNITNVKTTSTGGLINVKGNVTILNSNITDNTGFSGILYSAAALPAFAQNGTLIIDNTNFINNSIVSGTSVVSVGNATSINNSRFIANKNTRTSSPASGSAVNIAGKANVIALMNITNSVFVNNTATGEGSTFNVGSYGTLNVSNSIILRNDTNPVNAHSYDSRSGTTSAVGIYDNNYWGINDNPAHTRNNILSTQFEYYDDWEEEDVLVNYKITFNNWVIIDTTLTEDENDNTLFNVESVLKLNNTSQTITDFESTLPEYLNVTYSATAGRYDSTEVPIVDNEATNVYHADRVDSTLTVSVPEQEFTFEVAAPVIDPKNYNGLQKIIDVTDDGTTLELEKDCTRAASETSVNISGRNIVIDGKGYTIDENDGRLFIISNSNVTFKNLNIKNAAGVNGSVIQATGSNIILENVTISDSNASATGALITLSSYSNATIDNVTFIDNVARLISSHGNNLTINNTVIKNSVFNTGSTTEGLIIYSSAPLTITNSLFTENEIRSTSTGKGSIYLGGSAVTTTVYNTSFINNVLGSTGTTSYSGSQGAVFYLNSRAGRLNVNRSTFINNTGATNGNVIYNYYGQFNVSNSVLLNNYNETYKVALHNYDDRSYANNNWWGTNDDPITFLYRTDRYEIVHDSWVIMNATASEPVDNKITITTTFDKVTNSAGTISNLVGQLPDGFEVAYTVNQGSVESETSAVVDNVATVDVTLQNEGYNVTVTQSEQSVTLAKVKPIGDYTALQDAITNTDAGLTVSLNQNVTRANSEVKVTVNKDLTIDGSGFTVDANQGTFIEITNDATVTIKNVVITNGNAASLVNVIKGNLILDNVTIDNSSYGSSSNANNGLITVGVGSQLTLNNSVIDNIDNIVINTNGTNTSIINSNITNSNTGSVMAGIVYTKGNLTIINSTFEKNTAYTGIVYGGATSQYLNTGINGTVTIEGSKFLDNAITSGNGAVNVGNTTTINNSIFIGNKATRDSGNAGALSVQGTSQQTVTLTVTDSIFINNTAGGSTSTFHVAYGGNINITNSIILRNDTKPVINQASGSTGVLDGNYWGINDNPKTVENPIISNSITQLNNYIIIDTTLTEDENDNTLFNVESILKLVDSEDVASDLETTLPEYLNITYSANTGSFDDEEVAIVDNKASNVYHAGLTDATITLTVPDQEITFDVAAPVIDSKNYKGLQKLIDATDDGATLELVKDCTRATTENNVTIKGKNIVIDGKGFTIDINGNGTDGRLFLIENANVTLKNLIIKNAGQKYNPSVLQVYTGSIVLENVTIIDSKANRDGSLLYVARDANATINNVTIANNSASILSSQGSVVINNTTVINTNAAENNNYWAFNNGKLNITNSVFDSNIAGLKGIATGTSSNITIDNSSFINNKVESSNSTPVEGAVISANGSLVIKNSLFENNTATGGDNVFGLIYIATSTATVDNTKFINNAISTTGSGYKYASGGIFYINTRSASLNVTKSTFINNSAQRGAIITTYWGAFNVSNSILIDNNASTDKYVFRAEDSRYNYANNNWWGSNDNPSSLVGVSSSSYTIGLTNWVIMEATASDVVDGVTTITTTFNKVSTASGEVSDLVGTLPDGLEVTYNAEVGTVAESSVITDGQTTVDVTVDEGNFDVFVTQAYETIEVTLEEEIGDLIITNDTYSKFFNEDGTPKSVIKAGDVVYLSGEFTNKNFVFNIPVNLTTAEDQAILVNSTIVLNSAASNTNITNLIINNTDYAPVVVTIVEANNVNLTNNTITTINNAGTTVAIAFNETEGLIIENNTINVTGKSYKIDYNYMGFGQSKTAAIQGYASDESQIIDNTINIKGLGNGGSANDQDTIIGIEAGGEFSMTSFDYVYTSDSLVSDNRINITGDAKYEYGIRFGNYVDGTIVNNNTISVESSVYGAGVEIGASSESQALYNNITVKADNFAYGIYLSTNNMGPITDVTVYQNNITLEAKDAYGIELYGADDNYIGENNIALTGDYTIGIAGYNADGNTISDNNITVKGDSSQTKQTTSDYIGQNLTGIYLSASDTTSDNTITTNNIAVEDISGNDAYTVIIDDGEDNTVTENTLIGTNTQGDKSVITTEDDVVSDNLPSNIITISAIDVTVKQGETATVIATVTDSEGEAVNAGKVTFTVNDEVTEVDVIDGQATFDYTNVEGIYTIDIAYVENGLYDEATTTATVTVEFGKLSTIITINEFTATPGETTIISASVVDSQANAINGGKVAFKVNGVTLKDENGKVIYAKVVDGVASIEYAIPESWANKDLSISAVYSGTTTIEGSRSENATINFTQTQEPTLTIEPITEVVKSGSQITLKASITGVDTPVSTGKVSFKINGKTVKDANGKVVYGKIVDGQVTVDCVLDAALKSGEYKVTAVYTSTQYGNLEAQTTIKVQK